MTAMPFRLRAGARALEHIRRNGLAPDDIACIPAAAGGPKGLALIPLDRWLFGEWLPRGSRMPTLVGASIGAWRMTAAAQLEPRTALDRLAQIYVHSQRYRMGTTPAEVAEKIVGLAESVAKPWLARSDVPLRVIVSRAVGPLAGRTSRGAFARMAVDNAFSRARLARHLNRHVFASGPESPLDALWQDPFATRQHALTADNCVPVLTASGSIPLICDAVGRIPGMPDAQYWDGGLIDYHIHLPYHRLPGITLYPHFVEGVTPGWLDKFLPWRKQGFGKGPEWLSSMLLIAPSPDLLAKLPNAKLPDRNDFYRYGPDHEAREAAWRRAMGECERIAEAFARWVERPDPALLLPL
ncbi:hypothetical protein [Niveibacterium umoris]|uniref:Patatin-like phospholipase family protein n=1 Tax=Niveibacterium umoris TaxID=1193620 RepID=A0A840BLQ7_9RHOO|nr:hypothetical protein [Niveibacterium umoris]MBB4014165.1 hypothetical protein [Niveibacterium umoris]